MRIRLTSFLLVLTLATYTQDQIKIDSLKIRLESIKDDTIKIKTLIDLSTIYTKSNYIEAVKYSKQALEVALLNSNEKLLAKAYSNLGNRLLYLGNYDEALKNYLLGLRIAEKTSIYLLKFEILHNIGVLNDRLQLFDEALKYYFLALGFIENESVKKSITKVDNYFPVIYNSIGNIYETRKDVKISKEYYLKAYDLAKGKNDEIFGVICNNLGKLEIGLGNSESAFKYLNESLEFRKKINDQFGISKTNIFLALHYKNINNLPLAIEFAQKSLEISKQTNALLTYMNAASLLSEIYELVPDYQKSLEYHKLFKSLNDSIINDRKYSEIAKLQLQYENEIANREKEVKDQRKRLLMIILSSTLFLSFIIMGLLFILAKSRNRRIELENEKLEKEMQLKNKELTTNVMYLLKKNELIESITERLLKLKGKMKEENVEPIQKIIFDLQSITEKEVWEEFEYRFQSVHEEFYQTLQKKFPDLSPSEIKLAAFLRLNMTTKEIASITGQSINSLETARYRLRKKLGITNQEVNLVNFLLNI